MTFEHLQKLIGMMFVPTATGDVAERYDAVDAGQLSPLVQAYVGDAWFHLFVRTRLLAYEQAHVQALSEFSTQIVSAVWQSHALHEIAGQLTDDERGIVRRGCNAKSRTPRSATPTEYHNSTGLEALLGTLYLTGQHRRLQELSEAAFQAIARNMMKEKKAGVSLAEG